MKARHILPFVILCSLFLSCKDDRPFEDAYLWQNNASLTASLTTLLFEADASTQTVAINTNSGYGITVDQTWLTVERAADNQTLTVSVQANTTSATRNATITINASGKSQTISVTQQAAQSTSNDERTFTITGNGKTVTFKMIKVEGGTFQMGRAGSEDVETPVHSVTLTKTYYMCETEVTQALWYAIMGQSPTSDVFKWDSTYGLGDNYPAYYISYEDCQSFLSALNSKLSSQLGSGEQFRFPTEAEWEFAAKGGNKSKGYTYAGSNTIDDVAWYNDNSSSTHQIKTKAPNELGLYDMSGNVWEWCEDWYGSYSTGAQTDPTGAAPGLYRVYRGGSWYDYAGYCRVSLRTRNPPEFRYYNLGLRLALGAPVPSHSVSPTSLFFGASASSKTVNVTANGDYTFSTSASWLTITQSSDKTTLTVSAEANTGTSERTATITLTLGSLTQTISVTQQAAANTYDEERTFTVTGNGKTVIFKMIKVEGGTFQMGRAGSEDVETPVHSVTLTKTYYMCETEVTQALWYAIMGLSPTSDGSRQWNSTEGLGDNYPAYYISYEDCPSFLSALNSKLSSQLGNGEQFRFPTEAEWEFAAKGGNKSKGYTYSGSNTIGDVAWYKSNSNSTTHPVKTKSPNELGLYDMSGNVDEWCYDWYSDYYSSAQTDPTGDTWGSYRVLRGGSWPYIAEFCRVAFRRYNSPMFFRYNDYGLRLALGAPIE
ncbi:MAG: SUMF1/EgtB/PvdO family nonheme iron enzyme [Bacteroidaceae bacterium]|nr:SUMF1/EgtB/PvdO family nonheme iron enzyme [Bacteroidaceae bacterium]